LLFDTTERLAFAVVCQEATLIKPDTRQDERAIATFAFDLTLFQVRRLDQALKEQFNGLFAICSSRLSDLKTH
jgi:hypothetical protein